MKKQWGLILAVLVAMVVMVTGGCGGGGSGSSGSGGGGTISKSISGTVTASGVGLSGVTVTLSGSSSSTATTDSNGNYSISSVQDGSYTVTPSLTGYTFSLGSQSITVNGANVTGKNFTATASTVNPHSISGTITSGGTALAGVTVSTSGSSASTDASGNYSISGLVNGSYSLTATKSGYIFTPANLSVTVNGANVTGKNFAATPTAVTHSISGNITVGGSALAGVAVATNNGESAFSDASGNYTISGLANGSYSVATAKTGYVFTPASIAVTVNGANVFGQNFSANVAYSISGTIHSVSNSGPTLSGATVWIANKSAVTSSTGTFTITGIPAGTYTFSVSKSGYDTYTNPAYHVGSNQAGLTFYLTIANSSLVCPESRSASINGIQFYGTTSYQLGASGAESLTWGAYYQNINYLPTGSYSGSLRARLWAVPYSFSGGSINGYAIGTFTPNFTGTGAYSSNQLYVGSYTLPTSSTVTGQNSPPTGAYCIVATIEEFNTLGGCADPSGYCYGQWIQYNGPVSFL